VVLSKKNNRNNKGKECSACAVWLQAFFTDCYVVKDFFEYSEVNKNDSK